MAPAAGAIVAWAVEVGLDEREEADLLAGYCERLIAAGVPLWRVSTGADTLHPLIEAQGHRWRAGEEIREEFFARDGPPEHEEEWLRSPWRWMVENGEERLRRRLEGRRGHQRVPAARRTRGRGRDRLLVAAGALRRARGYSGETRGLAASSSRRARRRGFAADDLALIEATLPAFALACKSSMGAGDRAHAGHHLSRSRRGGARAARRDQARPRQHGAQGAVVQRPHRLHADRRHPAARAAARPAQRLRRLPRRGGPRPRRRGPEVHGRRHPRGVRRCGRPQGMRARASTPPQAASVAMDGSVNRRALGAPTCRSPASRSRCTPARSSTATSAAREQLDFTVIGPDGQRGQPGSRR